MICWLLVTVTEGDELLMRHTDLELKRLSALGNSAFADEPPSIDLMKRMCG